MASVQKVNHENHTYNIINAKSTGFAALGSMGFTIACAKTRQLRKYHRPFAYITGLFALSHIWIVERHTLKNKIIDLIA